MPVPGTVCRPLQLYACSRHGVPAQHAAHTFLAPRTVHRPSHTARRCLVPACALPLALPFALPFASNGSPVTPLFLHLQAIAQRKALAAWASILHCRFHFTRFLRPIYSTCRPSLSAKRWPPGPPRRRRAAS